jgi:hypothetical protein
MIERIEKIIQKFNPKAKIKPAKGFIKWYLNFFNMKGICLIDNIYYIEKEYVSNGLLFHEGRHMFKMRQDGIVKYALRYFFLWPIFKTWRFKYEMDAYKISF